MWLMKMASTVGIVLIKLYNKIYQLKDEKKTYRGDTKTVVVGYNGDGGHFVFYPMSYQFTLKITNKQFQSHKTT